MRRVLYAAVGFVLASTPVHADFRTEFVQVFVEVGAKTLAILIEKRGAVTGAMAVGIVSNAIYDKVIKDRIGTSDQPTDSISSFRKDCLEGKHNIFCPDRNDVTKLDSVSVPSLELNLRINRSSSNEDIANSVRSWLGSQNGVEFAKSINRQDPKEKITPRIVATGPYNSLDNFNIAKPLSAPLK